MKVGTLEGVRDKIIKLGDILTALGGDGTFSLTPKGDRRWVDLKINDSTSLQLSVPLTMNYKVQAGVVAIEFQQPYPRGRWKGLSKDVSFVEASIDRVDIGLNWSPDISLEVKS